MNRVWPILACALLLQGCALALVGAGGAAGVAGADYMQQADRTFTAPIDQVHVATTRALAQMDLKPTEDTTTAEGRHIVAHAHDRTIDIDLDTVSPTTTRMSVAVKTYSGLLRDGATADQVVQKTTDLLTSSASAAPPPPAAAPAPLSSSPPAENAAPATPDAPPPGPPAPVESAPLLPAH